MITNPTGRLGRRGFLRGTAALAGAAGIVADLLHRIPTDADEPLSSLIDALSHPTIDSEASREQEN